MADPAGHRHARSPQGTCTSWASLALAYVGAVVLGFGLQYAQGLLTTWLGQSVMYDLRTEIFAHFQRLDLRFFDKNPVGRLMTRITNDVETLNELFSSGVVTVFGDVFTLLFIVVAMLRMDWRLALVTFSVLPLVFIAAFVFRARIRTAYRDIRVRLARLNAFLHERFTGVRVVQLFNREDADMRRHAELNASYLEAHLRSITYYALFFPVIEFFTAIALALILWYGGFQILARGRDRRRRRGLPAVRPALLPAHPGSLGEVQPPAGRHGLVGARVQAPRSRDIAVTDPVDPVALPVPLEGRIEFRDVWFAYGNAGGRRARLGAQGRELRRRARREGGHRRPHRRGQDHAHQPADALLRRGPGRDPAGRRAHRPPAAPGSPRAHRPGAPGRLPVQPGRRLQHPPGRHRTSPTSASAQRRRARGRGALHRATCRRGTTRRWASGAPPCRWESASS